MAFDINQKSDILMQQTIKNKKYLPAKLSINLIFYHCTHRGLHKLTWQAASLMCLVYTLNNLPKVKICWFILSKKKCYLLTQITSGIFFNLFNFQTSEHIEQLHIDAKQATLKFKDKTISVNRVDFSDSLSKLHKYGYDVLSQDWELVAQGEKETPLQKYQRLQCELKELMDEVSQIKVIFVRQFSSYNLIFFKKKNLILLLFFFFYKNQWRY